MSVEHPGVFIQEIPSQIQPIEGVPTSITVFLGRTEIGRLATEGDGPEAIYSYDEYQKNFGPLSRDYPVSYAVQDFFRNGGTQAVIARIQPGAKASSLQAKDYTNALAALDKIDIFNLLCIPPDTLDAGADVPLEVWSAAAEYCLQRRAMVIIDSPTPWTLQAKSGNVGPTYQDATIFNLSPDQARNAMVYFPRVIESDPLIDGKEQVFPPCGVVAGIIATKDANRGVWKAPAGIEAVLNGVVGLELTLHDVQNGILNSLAINCLRTFPGQPAVIWGARTLRGADIFADDFKYIPVRRLTLYLEESIHRGTKWAVYEANDEQLWSALRLSTNAFMAGLRNQGAFFEYFVNCDHTTTTQDDIDQGIVNIQIGFAPVKPAEFVVIYIQQIAGLTKS